MPQPSPLIQAYLNHPLGLCRQHDPAKAVEGVAELEQRINILTLGTVLSINPINAERWSALAALHDHWLLDPAQVAYRTSAQTLVEMQQLHSGGPAYIARVWWQICRGIQGRFKGVWRDLFSSNGDNAQALQRYLQQNRATFPVLAGPVISARWLDLIHRNGGVPLQGWEALSMPLSPRQIKAARKWGIAKETAHPLLASALEVWAAACRGQASTACGLSECPEKQAPLLRSRDI